MKNKIISLLLALSLCFAFCACGNGANSNEQSPAQVNPVSATETVDKQSAGTPAENAGQEEQKSSHASETKKPIVDGPAGLG